MARTARPAIFNHEVFPMRSLQSICRSIYFVFLTVAAWAAGEAMVLAKDTPGAAASEGGGAWIWAYMIMLLVLSLGMIAVCKSSGRRERAKPEVYTETKPLPKE
jgi:hypothetical protein